MLPFRRMSWLALAVAAAAVLASSCSKAHHASPPTPPSSPAHPSSSETVALEQDCTPQRCGGQRAGAAFEIKVPARTKWNGTLLIWSHGYRNAGPIPTDPIDPRAPIEQPDTSAQASPSGDITTALLDQGYALAGSAFKTNGWDVADGVAAGQDLYTYFSDTFGRPRRVYVWGGSLGGLITQTLAETHASWISGVAPLCGVLGGTNLNLDLALDVAYAVKTLVYPQLRLTGFASQADAVAQWQAASRAVVAKASAGDAAGIADLVVIAELAGSPSKTERFDGHDPISIGQAYAQAIVTALGYGTWGRYDLEQRVGGNPSQNSRVDYSARLTGADRATVNAVAPGQLDPILAKLKDGPRVSSDAAARAKADRLGNPTGAIQRPTITLHTEDDPLVLVQNENVFARRVDGAGAQGQLVQLFTAPPNTYSQAPYGAGHCNFTKTELLGVIALLDDWARSGKRASPDLVARAFGYSDSDASAKSTPDKRAKGTADTGYDPAFTPGPWPAPITR